MTSFFHEKPLKSKNKKHRIFWNTEFYDPAKFQLKQMKSAKVVSRLQIFASYGPTVEETRRLMKPGLPSHKEISKMKFAE